MCIIHTHLHTRCNTLQHTCLHVYYTLTSTYTHTRVIRTLRVICVCCVTYVESDTRMLCVCDTYVVIHTHNAYMCVYNTQGNMQYMHEAVCMSYARQYVIDTHVCIMFMYYNIRITHTQHTDLYTHTKLPVTASYTHTHLHTHTSTYTHIYIHTHLHTHTHNIRITHMYL